MGPPGGPGDPGPRRESAGNNPPLRSRKGSSAEESVERAVPVERVMPVTSYLSPRGGLISPRASVHPSSQHQPFSPRLRVPGHSREESPPAGVALSNSIRHASSHDTSHTLPSRLKS